MNENVDARRIAEVLNRHEVQYLIIGGYGAELHEVADLPPTRDVDVCPSTDRANLERLSLALTELQALIRTDAVDGGLPFSHDAESLARADMWTLVCDAGELDISFQPSGGGYEQLKVRAVVIELLGEPVPVASIDDIIASKTAAGRPKDLSALPLLRRHQQRTSQQSGHTDDVGLPMAGGAARATPATVAADRSDREPAGAFGPGGGRLVRVGWLQARERDEPAIGL